jgi:outer membrane protein, multidrug efflux system
MKFEIQNPKRANGDRKNFAEAGFGFWILNFLRISNFGFWIFLLLPGCKVGPNYHTPATSMPAAWGEAGKVISSQPTSPPSSQPAWRVAAQPAELVLWWRRFNDPVLDQLIEQSIVGNPTLHEAQARVRFARAERQITAAGLWPSVDATAAYTHDHFSKNSFGGGLGGNFIQPTTGPSVGGGGGGGGGGGISRDFNLFQVGFDASWELDVFGQVRREVEAADANVAAAIEDRRDVLVSLLAEVGLNYMQLRGFQRQIVIAQENIKAQQQSLALTQLRLEGGIATELDVDQAAAQVATSKATIPPLEASVRQVIHLLSILTGRAPMALAEQLESDAPIPAPPPEIPLGMPSDLLRQRADIRRAERQLAAATANIGVAVAGLYPSFSLTGNVGLSSSHLHNLGDASSIAWSAGPSMDWPIFRGGAIRANIRAQTALQEQAAAAYEQTVLTSLKDVEDALAAYAQEQVHVNDLTSAVAANQKALDMANLLFEEGLADFLNVLVAQRALFIAQDAQVRAISALSGDVVTLYKALGGGWQSAPGEGETTNPDAPISSQENSCGGVKQQ